MLLDLGRWSFSAGWGKDRGGAPQEEPGQPNSSLLTTKNTFQYLVTNMVEPVCNLKIIPVEKQCKVNRLAYFLKTKKKNKNWKDNENSSLVHDFVFNLTFTTLVLLYLPHFLITDDVFRRNTYSSDSLNCHSFDILTLFYLYEVCCGVAEFVLHRSVSVLMLHSFSYYVIIKSTNFYF